MDSFQLYFNQILFSLKFVVISDNHFELGLECSIRKSEIQQRLQLKSAVPVALVLSLLWKVLE